MLADPEMQKVVTKLLDGVKRPLLVEAKHSPFVHPLDWLLSDVYRVAYNSSFLSRKPREEAIYSYFQHVNGNFPANPNNSELSELYDAIYSNEGGYLESEYLSGDVDEFSEKFARNLCEEKYFCLVGNRGRGKTMLTNRFFTKYTNDLEKNRNLIWFRIDANKIYDLQGANIRENNSLLEKYYYSHTAYVLFRYCSFRLANEYQHPYSDMFRDVFKEIMNGSERDKDTILEIFVKWGGIYRSFHSNNEMSNLYISERIVEDIIFSRKNTSLRDARMVFDIFFQKFSERGTHIATIIDGIDNVAWSKSNSGYREMCDETSEFIKRYDSKYPGRYCICLVTRPETITELEIGIEGDGYHAKEMEIRTPIHFVEQRIASNEIVDIIKCKDTAALESNIFSEKRATAISKTFDDHAEKDKFRGLGDFHYRLGELFQTFSEGYLENLATIINDRLAKTPFIMIDRRGSRPWNRRFSEQDVFEGLFNLNTRATIDARLNALRTERIFETIGRVRSDDRDRMLQYTLLGGSGYKYSQKITGQSRYQKIRRGNVLPNIFWYDLDESDNTYEWEGLSGIRLLQLLVHESHRTAGEAICILHRYFGYSISVLAEKIEAFVAFGLLDIDYSRGEKSVDENTRDVEKLYNCYVKVTNKAYILSQLSFYDPEFLYYLCLDTPIRRRMMNQNLSVANHVRLDLAGDAESLYPDSELINCYTLLRQLFQRNAAELQRSVDLHIEEGDFVDRKHFVSIFDLGDNIFHISEQIFEESVENVFGSDRRRHGVSLDAYLATLDQIVQSN